MRAKKERAITLCNGGLMALSGKQALSILQTDRRQAMPRRNSI
jgi:hypothetical protein